MLTLSNLMKLSNDGMTFPPHVQEAHYTISNPSSTTEQRKAAKKVISQHTYDRLHPDLRAAADNVMQKHRLTPDYFRANGDTDFLNPTKGVERLKSIREDLTAAGVPDGAHSHIRDSIREHNSKQHSEFLKTRAAKETEQAAGKIAPKAMSKLKAGLGIGAGVLGAGGAIGFQMKRQAQAAAKAKVLRHGAIGAGVLGLGALAANAFSRKNDN